MGHLFRALNLAGFLKDQGQDALILVNDHPRSLEILKGRGLRYQVVPLQDLESGWEEKIIKSNAISVWINDRHGTDLRHARRVKGRGAKLVTFDDGGSGAGEADLHFSPLAFDGRAEPQGKTVLRGLEYLVLDREIERFKRLRTREGSIVVSMGGSDTYGATVKVVRQLKAHGKRATVVLGPAFAHWRDLEAELTSDFQVRREVSSLPEEFGRHELAITGGGVTPFEAGAAGLPCIVVANETFEIPAARYLQNLGCAVFAGHHTELDGEAFGRCLNHEAMSRAGMMHITTRGAENVCRALDAL
jgi:spore coat polysaccharide biosynthesis predicted glycosyltransferase SpsG